MELDDLATKYKDLMDQSNKLAVQAKKYRNRIRKWLVDHEKNEATTPHWRIKRSISNRVMMVRKDTPPDIWQKYAVQKEQETIYIRSRNGS